MTRPEGIDFWLSSGFRLLERDAEGRLRPTDDYLRAYLIRPEVRPTADACAEELALHRALTENPRLPVEPGRLARLADPDVRENYAVVLRFRDALVAAGSVEACYLSLFRAGRIDLPPLFIDQLAHVILRNILDGCDDPLRLRAAELLFRSQKVSPQDAGIMLADDETVEMHATTGGLGALGQLLTRAETPLRQVELTVLGADNAAAYWKRSDKFDTVLDLAFARPGLDALCRVLEAWVRHMLGVEVSVQPLARIDDDNWVWHVGLDIESSAILNRLYQGEEVGEERLARLITLFRLEFADRALMLPRVAGRPVYLGLAMDEKRLLKLKPQNLLLNLPLAQAA